MIVRSFFGNRKVNPSVDLDEKSLIKIAESTGGQYYRARNTDELNNIYMRLDELEPVEKDKQYFRPRSELYYWPLSLALGSGGGHCVVQGKIVMNIAEFHFIRPYWLLALIPYLAILAVMLRNKLSQGNWSAVCDAALLPYLLQEKAVNQSRWPITAGAIAALLAIIALAGPTWERLPSPVFRNDSALIIALDLSRSMDAADIKPSRLVMARYKIADILKQRKDGQTALLVYAGDAFTVTPLTDDTETIDSQLSALNTDIMPSQGSNTVSALEKAVELFKQAGLQKGQILLVTDGVDVDKTLAAVKSLDKYQLSILGVGTDDGAPVALPEGGFLKDEQGNIVVPKLNSSELKKLAQAGNGVYQTITANNADIQAVLANVDRSVAAAGQAKR